MIEDIDISTSCCKSLSSPYICGIQYMKNQWNTDSAGKIPESCGCRSPGVTSRAQVSNPAQCSSHFHISTCRNKEQEKSVSGFPVTWLCSDEVQSLFRLKCPHLLRERNLELSCVRNFQCHQERDLWTPPSEGCSLQMGALRDDWDGDKQLGEAFNSGS